MPEYPQTRAPQRAQSRGQSLPLSVAYHTGQRGDVHAVPRRPVTDAATGPRRPVTDAREVSFEGPQPRYGGGQWPVLAALLACNHARAGSPHRATELLEWVAGTADDDLLLPEQVPPMLAPGVLDEWLERWGPSAHPLVWSHGLSLAALAVLRDDPTEEPPLR